MLTDGGITILLLAFESSQTEETGCDSQPRGHNERLKPYEFATEISVLISQQPHFSQQPHYSRLPVEAAKNHLV